MTHKINDDPVRQKAHIRELFLSEISSKYMNFTKTFDELFVSKLFTQSGALPYKIHRLKDYIYTTLTYDYRKLVTATSRKDTELDRNGL